MGNEAKIYLGTSGFSFPDWVGTVYPKGIKKSEMFDYYIKNWKFNALEVNFTYYTFPSQKAINSLLKRSPENFCFVFKAPQDITHKLWKEENTEALETISKDFLSVLKPVKEFRILGGILFQFPYSFKKTSNNFEYLKNLSAVFENEVELFVEFRNRVWANRETVDFLRENKLAYVTVDEPKIDGLFPYVPGFTTESAYFRFHGRNTNWFEAKGSERYDYFYSEDELKKFADDVKKILSKIKKVLVFFNNCHNGSAVKNALSFSKLLT